MEEVPEHLEVKQILRGKQLVVHDGGRFQVVERRVVEFLVALTGRRHPSVGVVLRDVVDPAAVPEGLELHGVQFEGGGVGVAGHGTVGVGGPIASRKIGVHVSGFVAVVVGELLEEGGHEVVGHLRVGVLRKDAGRIDVLGHRVHAHPRQLVHSRELVLVVRLVLVEDDGHVECIVRFLDHAGGLDFH